MSKMEVEAGVAMNEALSENLFVSCVCVLNLLPLFIVGKPGTSKTLAMQDSNCHPHVKLPATILSHIISHQCKPPQS